MNRSSSNSSLFTRLVQGLFGVLGLYAALRLLPRLLRLLTRRFIFGLIGEILLVALGLFLTRRATHQWEENGAPQRADPSSS